jgi:hypothetical protein
MLTTPSLLAGAYVASSEVTAHHSKTGRIGQRKEVAYVN